MLISTAILSLRYLSENIYNKWQLNSRFSLVVDAISVVDDFRLMTTDCFKKYMLQTLEWNNEQSSRSGVVLQSPTIFSYFIISNKAASGFKLKSCHKRDNLSIEPNF